MVSQRTRQVDCADVRGSVSPGREGGSLTSIGPALVNSVVRPETLSPGALSCLVCGALLRRWFAKSSRHFTRCPACRLVVVPEGVARNDRGQSIYEAEDDVFSADGNDGYYMDHESNLANSRLKLRWVRRDLAPGSRLLDAGSNFGHFLKVAQETYDATGFDLSPAAVAWSKRQFGVRSAVASVYETGLPPESFDGVTSWDVVEHLADPPAALAELRRLLRPGGRLFLSTPDAGSFTARAMGRRWHYLDPVQHITVFSRDNLKRLLERSGFSVTRTGAMGHRYRIRYVFDRLRYLHPHGALGFLVSAGRFLAAPLGDRTVYLQLGDVVVLTATRTA
jgi:2-polyprenyl-3-methyl-5-hydroxy-6-metoxy-1,4-benzoquinol methylase